MNFLKLLSSLSFAFALTTFIPTTFADDALKDFKKDGEYYIVTGRDLKDLRGEFLDKKVKITVAYEKSLMEAKLPVKLIPEYQPAAQTSSVEGTYKIMLRYADIPDDIKTQFEKGGIAKGNKIQIQGTVIQFGQNPTQLGGAMFVTKEACYIKIDKWSRAK